MPSQLVDDVRRLIRQRTEEGRPLTMSERALLLATLAPPRRDGADAVDELDAAIAHARRTLLVAAVGLAAPERAALTRLLAAARAVLDHAPADYDPTATMPTERARPARADVDG